ncbi:hypothetical protein T484DRAFT_3362576 [Baffinella frigidus]|nr:hypothetical protein T484DRAFT_3362576 [Cryptophyta sp. CCMP2293]
MRGTLTRRQAHPDTYFQHKSAFQSFQAKTSLDMEDCMGQGAKIDKVCSLVQIIGDRVGMMAKHLYSEALETEKAEMEMLPSKTPKWGNTPKSGGGKGTPSPEWKRASTRRSSVHQTGGAAGRASYEPPSVSGIPTLAGCEPEVGPRNPRAAEAHNLGDGGAGGAHSVGGGSGGAHNSRAAGNFPAPSRNSSMRKRPPELEPLSPK